MELARVVGELVHSFGQFLELAALLFTLFIDRSQFIHGRLTLVR